MPLIISCPISGANILVPNFGQPVCRLISPHPLLSLTITQLQKVQETSTAKDSHILLCAWLEQLSQLEIAHWVGKLTPDNFSLRWHEQQLEKFTDVIIWLHHNKNHPALGVVPQVRITPELNGENLQAWRESCQSIIASYTTYFDIAETLRIRENLAQAERLLSGEYLPPSTKISAATRKLHSRQAYLTNSLGLHENQGAVEIVIKVCATPQSYEVQTIQKVKEFCLDYLPENGIENYNDKQEVIQILDAAILDKLGMAAILGVNATPQHMEISAELTAKYSIVVDGQTFINGAFPSVTKSIQRINHESLGKIEVKTYDSEPQREDFKSHIGYIIAHKQWYAQTRK
jgi:hypothetical protein